jgi:hypothetical protein
LHEQTDREAVQRVGMRRAKTLAARTRPPTPHPSISADSRNAIGDAPLHDGIRTNLREPAKCWKRTTKTKDLELAAEGLKSKKPRTLSRSGRSFLQERVYTNFYFFVKGNLQLFLFFLELVSFQEHSSSIPQSIFPCAATGLARIPAS